MEAPAGALSRLRVSYILKTEANVMIKKKIHRYIVTALLSLSIAVSLCACNKIDESGIEVDTAKAPISSATIEEMGFTKIAKEASTL